MDQKQLSHGGVYLAKLNPHKGGEISKIRPVIILTAQKILDAKPPIVFICPLSSKSLPAHAKLHVALPSRDNLRANSYALVEHCRSISVDRLNFPRIAKIDRREVQQIIFNLNIMVSPF